MRAVTKRNFTKIKREGMNWICLLHNCVSVAGFYGNFIKPEVKNLLEAENIYSDVIFKNFVE
jgi:hypothetical protein